MEIIFEVHEAVMTARLFGELDHHAAAEIRETIDCSLKQYAMRDLVFDFANVTYMDSSGIGRDRGMYEKRAHDPEPGRRVFADAVCGDEGGSGRFAQGKGSIVIWKKS